MKHFDRAADMVEIAPFSWHCRMDLRFDIHEAALLKPEAVR